MIKVLLCSFLLLAIKLPVSLADSEVSLCNAQNVEKYLSMGRLDNLNIETKKPRKWAKNYFKIIGSKNTNILPKYKKKFSARIIANFSNGLSCNFKAKIRVNGDWKDHVKDAPPIIASLDGKLLTGNISSIAKFKLLLPHTRNGDNEIFVTTLLREMGFIAPKTYYVETLFNDTQYRYLFQEKAQKEMLEAHQLREGPILVGDERFTWLETGKYLLDHRFGLSRLVNKNWAEKGETSLKISQEAVSLLNSAYFDFISRSFSTEKADIGKPPKGWYLQSELLANGSPSSLSTNQQYNAILIALRATHGLRPHNRKFYYDPIYKHLLPIYYDGNSDVLEHKNLPFDRDFLPNSTKGAIAALKSISAIDTESFYEKLIDSGMKFSKKELTTTLNYVKARLEKLSKTKVDNKIAITANYFSKYQSHSKLLVFSTENDLEVNVCDYNLSQCRLKSISIAKYAEILNGRYQDEKNRDYVYIGRNKTAYYQGLLRNSRSFEDNKIEIIENNSLLVSYGSLITNINRKEKTIEIIQSLPESRALIVGGKLEGWKVTFIGNKTPQKITGQRFNTNLITGCLTFLDITLNQIEINANNAFCEDAVNLVRAKGQIEKITIEHAMSDALDIDFSNLVFNTAIITDAGNDCVDFSSGNYTIKTSILHDCSDKAISIGEASKASLMDVYINNANIGIAVKDSSVTTVNSATFVQTRTCLSVNKKKQEFWGSKLTVKNYNCPNGVVYQQFGSLIENKK